MITREQFDEKRDELMAQRDELVARAAHIREQFVDGIDDEAVTMTVGLTLISGGVAWGLTQAIRGRRNRLALLLPAGLVLGGLVMLSRSALDRRSAHIVSAEEHVREGLAGLDPLAKARVLRDIAGEQLAFVRRSQG